MLIKRLVILTSLMVAVLSATVWIADRGDATPPVDEIRMDVDSVSKGDVVHTLTAERDGTCPATIPFMETIGLIGPDEISKQIVIVTNDDCELVVEKIKVETRSNTRSTRTTDVDYEAWARLRLEGEFVEDDDSWDARAETEILYYLRETNTGFQFNNPLPRALCYSSDYPTIVHTNCDERHDVNTSQRKKLTATADMRFYGTPQARWTQEAYYDSRTSGSDYYGCSAVGRPSFLDWDCRGWRTVE